MKKYKNKILIKKILFIYLFIFFFFFIIVIYNNIYLFIFSIYLLFLLKTPNHGKLSTNLSGPLKFGLRYPQVETLFEEMKIIDCNLNNLQSKKKLSNNKGNNKGNNE